ncbi:sulfatase [Gracilibacillus sp. YIM 98692]|uniref:sulfatase n=1 Tax=Gracilibacillus sp. YIM 98692 TaxID=2663532 RepID=UPI0013D6C1A1|nr:sulfatase [Gracilibacillus sp. YIM 98692]
MKAIMVMFDSLNRHMLPPYGCDWVHAPNFQRLADKTVTFDNAYAGSLPCMPARRDLHTGRYNFLHRSWGPLEPFDHSMPEILKNNGVYTHLVSDHQHYWEDGGATYHTRYSSWESFRGQEGDPWKGHVKDPDLPETEVPEMKEFPLFRQDVINREYYKEEEQHPQAMTFQAGLEFIDKNKDEDQWFLQLETFDPHEPFTSYKKYKELYPHEYDGKQFDWPPYYFVREGEETVEHGKYEYAALLSMCDHYLGKVLDMMDENDMWEDTMLIVNTDHGYLLGEHGWWSKAIMPVYQEIAHIPMFMWDPRYKEEGQRNEEIVQLIDIAPTLLDFFDVEIPKEMTGSPIGDLFKEEKKNTAKDAALFGFHGGHVNIVDKNYVYMRGPVLPQNKPLYEYTLMPTHMRQMFSVNELTDIELEDRFSFTRRAKVMKMEAGRGFVNPFQYGSKLYDIVNDPGQHNEIEDAEVEQKLIKKMAEIMRKHEAPEEQYERLGIPKEGDISIDDLQDQHQQMKQAAKIEVLESYSWTKSAQNKVRALLNTTPEKERANILKKLEHFVQNSFNEEIDGGLIHSFVEQTFEKKEKDKLLYFINLAGRTH